MDEHSLDNDFLLICHGSSYLAGEQHHATTGTTILTIKRRDPLGTPGAVSAEPAAESEVGS